MALDRSGETPDFTQLLRSEGWKTSSACLPLLLGSDKAGEPVAVDLAEMPHLMVGGGEGVDRSEFIKASIASLMSRLGPDELRVVVLASSPAEFEFFRGQPHLVCPVVSGVIQQEVALQWVVKEMEARFQALAEAGVRDIVGFNSRARAEQGATHMALERLAYIVVILEEFGDVMRAAPAATDMETAKLTQMGGSAGIHCVVGFSGRALREVPRTITDPLGGRIALACASAEDSRRIVGCAGAEALKGTGDLMYRAPGGTTVIRAHAASASRAEMDAVLNQRAVRAGTVSGAELLHPRPKGHPTEWRLWDEELIQACIEMIRSKGRASTALMQGCLRLRYGIAAQIMDELEARGVVGPRKGDQPQEDREILIDLGPSP